MWILVQVYAYFWYLDDIIRRQCVSQRLLCEVIHRLLLLLGAQADLLECCVRNLAAILLEAVEAFKIAFQMSWINSTIYKFAWWSKLIKVHFVDRAVHT